MHLSTRLYGQVCNSSSLHRWATYCMGSWERFEPFDFESETLQNIMYDPTLENFKTSFLDRKHLLKKCRRKNCKF